MKLGIIGSGKMVEEFLTSMTALSNIEIRGICGTHRSLNKVRQMCLQYQLPYAVEEFEELLASGIDTVYIAVPNFLHYSYCERALKSGLNVIVEKPIASNKKETSALVELAMENKLFLYEAVTTTYLSGFRKIQEWLPQVGTIKIVSCNFSQYSKRYDAFCKGEIKPVFDAEKSGGALMDLNWYQLHFMIGLFGKPNEVQYFANVERGIDTSGILTMQYSGFQAVCIGAKDCESDSYCMIQGTNGYIKMDRPANQIGTVTLHRIDGTEEVFENSEWKNRLIPEFKTFEEKIREGDLQHCYSKLAESIIVSEIQTKARLQAGIVFPADK